MSSEIVDLRSDTVTRPTPGMREAMARAEVGDDVLGEDPTVNALQERVAAMVGKDAALFVPSGTMANLLAAVSQTRPGDTIVLDETAHPFNFESGGLGMVAGLMTKTLRGTHGVLSPELVEAGLVLQTDHHYSSTTLVSIENTTNRGGGQLSPSKPSPPSAGRCTDMRSGCTATARASSTPARRPARTSVTMRAIATPCPSASRKASGRPWALS